MIHVQPVESFYWKVLRGGFELVDLDSWFLLVFSFARKMFVDWLTCMDICKWLVWCVCLLNEFPPYLLMY